MRRTVPVRESHATPQRQAQGAYNHSLNNRAEKAIVAMRHLLKRSILIFSSQLPKVDKS